MKKILLYTDTPQIGGAELQIYLLAKFLNKEKFQPILCCSNYPKLDKWCLKFEKEGIKVIRIPVKHKHDPKHYKYLKKIIKEEKIDILHAQVWNPASCRYAYFAAGKTKTPLIITEHDPFKLSFFKDLFKRISLNKVAKIITVSQENAQKIKDLYPQHKEKISVIHNGIDTTWWQSQVVRFTAKERQLIKEKIFHAKEDTLIITTIAELHQRKGINYLLEGIALIKKEFPNIKCVIIGEGDERDHLENLAKKLNLEAHVTFLGRQNEIAKLLKSSDIFVLPSVREAFGFVNIEAMISGLPVIAANVGGIPEVIVDKKTGMLFERENAQDLSEKLTQLIKNPLLRTEMAKAGYHRVLENFAATQMAEKYEKIYLDSETTLT